MLMNRLAEAIQKQKDAKNIAYKERNILAAILSIHYPSGLWKTNIQGWENEWHNCVYIQLPTGQISFHFHDSELWMFNHLTWFENDPWDGHTTEEKLQRIVDFLKDKNYHPSSSR